MKIQEKLRIPHLKNKLLARYGLREVKRVEDMLKKLAALLAEIAKSAVPIWLERTSKISGLAVRREATAELQAAHIPIP